MQTHFKNLFRYDKWATQQLLSSFENKSPVNDRIYQLLSHVLSAQRIWLDRCTGLPQRVELWAERLPGELQNDTELYNLSWMSYLDTLDAADLNNKISYANSKGEKFNTRLTDIISHVINHGTHHRGEMLILMKEEGFPLPNIDYITFVR